MAPVEPDEYSKRVETLAELTLAMQAALSVSDVQSNYLQAITGLVRADAYGFSHLDAHGERLVPLSTLTREAPSGLVPDYNELGAEHDPVLAAAVAADAPLDNSRVMPAEAWRDHSLCEILGRHGLQHTMVVPLFGRDHRLQGTLYLARGADELPFGSADLAAMSLAKRHIEVALDRAARHDSLDQHASVLGWAFNQLDVPTILSAGGERVAFENAALRRLLGAHRAAKAPIAALLADNVNRLSGGDERVVASSTALPAPAGSAESTGLRLTVKSSALRRGSDAVLSFVFLQRKDVATPVDHTPLSAREREIVTWVAEGLTNREIAALAFISENTVRQHLKRIFGKLNVHSRAELVQAIWQGADLAE